eukprot:gene12603-8640_t
MAPYAPLETWRSTENSLYHAIRYSASLSCHVCQYLEGEQPTYTNEKKWMRTSISLSLPCRRGSSAVPVRASSFSASPGRRRPIDVICTMATEECRRELHLFLTTLRHHHPTIPVVIGCSSPVVLRPVTQPVTFSHAAPRFLFGSTTRWRVGRTASRMIHIFYGFPFLDRYRYPPYATPTSSSSRSTGEASTVRRLSRQAMERQRGVWYDTQHTDWMMEKANLLEWALNHYYHSSAAIGCKKEEERGGGELEPSYPLVAFMDADICFLGPLPEFHTPTSASAAPLVALSPHAIAAPDEALFGAFNGGYVAVSHPAPLHKWRRATQDPGNRFFDQSSLEAVWAWATAQAAHGSATAVRVPLQHNYGYWRLMQTHEKMIRDEAKKFSIRFPAPPPPPPSSPSLSATQADGSPPHTPPLGTATLQYMGAPLCSVHTHFFTPKENCLESLELSPSTSSCSSASSSGSAEGTSMGLFNRLLISWLTEACVQQGRQGSEAVGSSSPSVPPSVYQKVLGLLPKDKHQIPFCKYHFFEPLHSCGIIVSLNNKNYFKGKQIQEKNKQAIQGEPNSPMLRHKFSSPVVASPTAVREGSASPAESPVASPVIDVPACFPQREAFYKRYPDPEALWAANPPTMDAAVPMPIDPEAGPTIACKQQQQQAEPLFPALLKKNDAVVAAAAPGGRSSLRPQQREALGLPPPPPHNPDPNGATPDQVDKDGNPTHPNGTFIDKYIEIKDSKRPVFRGPRGGYFYLTAEGNRTALRPQQREALGLPENPGHERKPPTGTSTGKTLEIGDAKCEVLQGPRGGYFFINSRGGRSYLRPQQREALGLPLRPHNPDPNGATPDQVDKDGNPTHPNGTFIDKYIEIKDSKRPVFRGPRGGYFYLTAEGNRTALRPQQRESLELPQNPGRERKPPTGTSTGKTLEIGDAKCEVLQGPRGGYFFINSRGGRSYLRPQQREALGLPPPPPHNPDPNGATPDQVDKDGNPTHPNGTFIDKYIEIKDSKRPVFRGPRGGYFYLTAEGNRTALRPQQREALGLPQNPGRERKPPTGTSTGKTLEIGDAKCEVLQGPRGGYFFINSRGGRSSVRPQQREALGLPPPPPHNPDPNGATPDQVDKDGNPTHPNGTFIDKYIEIKDSKRPVFRGPRGGYFYLTAEGNRTALRPQQREALGLPQNPGRERKPPTGTSTGKTLEIGDAKFEVLQGPRGGYFFINSRGRRSSLRPLQREALDQVDKDGNPTHPNGTFIDKYIEIKDSKRPVFRGPRGGYFYLTAEGNRTALRPQQREALGLPQNPGRERKPPTGTSTGKTLEIGDAKCEVLQGPRGGYFFINSRGGRSSLRPQQREALGLPQNPGRERKPPTGTSTGKTLEIGDAKCEVLQGPRGGYFFINSRGGRSSLRPQQREALGLPPPPPHNPDPNGATPDQVDKDGNPTHPNGTFIDKYIEIKDSKRPVFRGPRGGYFYLTAEGNRTALRPQQREALGLPQNPGRERKPPTGTSTGKTLEIGDAKFEVLQGPRGGYFFINSRGRRSSLRPLQREALGLPPPPPHNPDPNGATPDQVDKDGNPTHPNGTFIDKYIEIKDSKRPVFRGPRGGYFYLTAEGNRTALRPQQREALGLPQNPGRERKPPTGTSTGKTLEIGDAKCEVLQGPRGGYFFINSRGGRSSLRPQQREALGLPPPPPHNPDPNGATPDQVDKDGNPTHPNGTFIDKYIEIKDSKRPVFRGPRGGYFYLTAEGNRTALRPQQREALGLPQNPGRERKPPTGTSTGKTLEIGDAKFEVLQGPRGGYFFINSRGGRSSLRPQQREALGLPQNPGRERKPPTGTSTGKTLEIGDANSARPSVFPSAPHNPDPNGATPDQVDKDGNPTHPNGTFIDKYIEIKDSKRPVFRGPRGGYFYLTAEGNRTALRPQQREALGLPQNPGRERKPPTGTSTGKTLEIGDAKCEVLQGPRGGYFFINSRGGRSSLRPQQREALGLPPPPPHNPDPNGATPDQVDKDGNPTHPNGTFIDKYIEIKDSKRPVFRGPRGGYFYLTAEGNRTALRPQQREALGLPQNPGRERKPPTGTSTGKTLEIGDAKFEVLQGPRGGYFFINSRGRRSSLRPLQREALGLPPPPPHNPDPNGATPDQVDKDGNPTHPNGTFIDKYIEIKDSKRPVFRGPRGGYFYLTAEGNRTALRPQQREALGLPQNPGRERKPPTGTSTGKTLEIGDAKCEVLQGPRGGYFFINSRGGRSSLRPQQREALGLPQNPGRERKPPTGTSTGKTLEIGDAKCEVLQGPRGGYFFINSRGGRSSLRPQQREALGLPPPPPHNPDPNGATPDQVDKDGNPTHPNGTFIDKYIEIKDSKRPVFRGPRGGYFYLTAEGNRTALRPQQREALGLPQNPGRERKPPTGTSTGKTLEIGDAKFEVLQGPRGGYFFINSRGRRSSLRPLQREALGLPPPPPHNPDPNGATPDQVDKDGNPTHPNGTFIDKYIEIKDSKRPVFRGPRGGYFYLTAEGNRTALRPQQREALGLPQNPGRERKPPTGTSTGKTLEIGDAKCEVLQGPRGGYFFINSRGGRSSLRPQQREALGLPPPPPHNPDPNGATPDQVDKDGNPTHPNGTFIDKYIEIKDSKRPVFRGPRGGYFYLTAEGNRTALRPQQREALGLPQNPGRERKPPTGTSTGKTLEIGDAKFEVLQGPRGGYFFINSRGGRSSLRPQQREALGLPQNPGRERKPPTGTSTGKTLEIGDAKFEVLQGPRGGYFFINSRGGRSSLRPQQREALGLPQNPGRERKPPTGTSTGKTLEIGDAKFEVLQGPRGGYFFINSRGRRSSLRPLQREALGLPPPPPHNPDPNGATPDQVDKDGNPTHPNGTFIDKYIEIKDSKRPVFRGPRGGYFYLTAEGNRTALRPQQRESLELPQNPGRERKPPTGTSTGKTLEIGDAKCEVLQGPRGGYFFINSRATGRMAKETNPALKVEAGCLLLRESAQCPPEETASFQDIEKHSFFNTNNLWIHLPALKALMDRHQGVLPLPVIRNAKTVDPTNPKSPEVYQLETAMGAAIAQFHGATALVVPRDRFTPVKVCGDLLALRSDAYCTTPDHRLILHPDCHGKPPVVSLSDRYKLLRGFESLVAKGVPSMLHCTRLTVKGEGPVVFGGSDIILKGEVCIENNDKDTVLEIPAGTVLENTTYTGMNQYLVGSPVDRPYNESRRRRLMFLLLLVDGWFGWGVNDLGASIQYYMLLYILHNVNP